MCVDHIKILAPCLVCVASLTSSSGTIESCPKSMPLLLFSSLALSARGIVRVCRTSVDRPGAPAPVCHTAVRSTRRGHWMHNAGSVCTPRIKPAPPGALHFTHYTLQPAPPGARRPHARAQERYGSVPADWRLIRRPHVHASPHCQWPRAPTRCAPPIQSPQSTCVCQTAAPTCALLPLDLAAP